MKNSYTLSEDGKTVTVWINHKGKRLACLIDAADLGKVDSVPRTWCATWKPKGRCFYVVNVAKVAKKQKTTSIHRFITDAPKGLEVDHWNHDTLDNRRCNLEIKTHSGNQMNRRGAASHSKTGHRGIWPDRRSGKFVLVVRIEGKPKYIGTFSTVEEAIVARNEFPVYDRNHLGYSEKSL